MRVNDISREVAEQEIMDLPSDANNHNLIKDIYTNYQAQLWVTQTQLVKVGLLKDHTTILLCKSLKQNISYNSNSLLFCWAELKYEYTECSTSHFL